MSSEEKSQGENQPKTTDAGQAKPTETKAKAPVKKKRNPIERIVVWVVLLGAIAFVGNELYSNYAFENSLKDLKIEVIEGHRAMFAEEEKGKRKDLLMTKEEMNEIVKFLSLQEVIDSDEEGKVEVVNVKWFSLLKDYSFQVGMDVSDPESPIVLAVREEIDDDEEKLEIFKKYLVVKRDGIESKLNREPNANHKKKKSKGPRGASTPKKNKKNKKPGDKTKPNVSPKGKPKT